VSEAREQAEFVKWFRKSHPQHAKALRASMAGLTFAGGGKWGAIMWNKMKAQGLVKGEPDLAILLPRGGYGALLIEHKGEGMARKLTDEQQEHLEYHNAHGNKAVQTRGLDELKQTVEAYLALEHTDK
jgi:hypothetical protein